GIHRARQLEHAVAQRALAVVDMSDDAEISDRFERGHYVTILLLACPGSQHLRLRTAVANIKSQIKRNRTNEKARLRNKAVKSEIKTRGKTAVRAAERDTDTIA